MAVRIAFTSDLHVDVTPLNGAILPHLADRVRELAPDAFVVAGDAANSLYQLDFALSAFEDLPCRRWFVPGNHDIWAESHRAIRKGKDSAFKHDQAIPAICKNRGFEFLPGSPLTFDGLGIVGSLGWFDFSFRPPALDGTYSVLDYTRGELNHPPYKTGVWNDCRDVVWLVDRNSDDWRRRSLMVGPLEIFEEIFHRFESDLDRVLPSVDRMLVVLHTNPFLGCLETRALPDPFDAYQGAARLGDKLAQVATRMPITCLCGHRHAPLDVLLEGVRVLRSPVGYLDGFKGDLSARAATCVGLIEV